MYEYYVYMLKSTPMSCSVLGGQKRASDPVEPIIQVLEFKLGFCARIASVLNGWAIPSGPHFPVVMTISSSCLFLLQYCHKKGQGRHM